jgi:Ca2+-binding EF-hand superfamily protein
MENEQELSERKITAIREVFSLFDKKNTGKLHVKYLATMANLLDKIPECLPHGGRNRGNKGSDESSGRMLVRFS